MSRRAAGEGNVRERKPGQWEGRYIDANGRSRSLYGPTKRNVTDRMRDALQQTSQGIVLPSATRTVAGYLAEWMRDYAKVRPTTLASYRHMVDRYIVPEIGRVKLAKLQPTHVASMLRNVPTHAARGDLSPTTVRHAYSVLRVALGRTLKLGYVSRSVATLVDPPAKAYHELVPFTAEQVRSLLDTTAKDRLGVLYLTAVATGLRQGELLGLRWSDVDLEALGTLTVRHTLQRGTRTLAEPKTDRARRIVPLPRRGIDALTTHRTRQRRERIAAGPRWHDDGYVFATPIGTALDPRNGLRRYHAALTAAGLPHSRSTNSGTPTPRSSSERRSSSRTCRSFSDTRT